MSGEFKEPESEALRESFSMRLGKEAREEIVEKESWPCEEKRALLFGVGEGEKSILEGENPVCVGEPQLTLCEGVLIGEKETLKPREGSSSPFLAFKMLGVRENLAGKWLDLSGVSKLLV